MGLCKLVEEWRGKGALGLAWQRPWVLCKHKLQEVPTVTSWPLC